MTPKEAATVIGCDVSQVRMLIRTGKLRATKKSLLPSKEDSHWFYYDVDSKDVQRYASTPQGRGYPRGRKRQ